MSKVNRHRSNDQRYDEASLWIERLDEGLNRDEELELEAWLASDSANRELLEKMARLWDKMDCLSRLSALVPQPAAIDGFGRRFEPYLAVAASMILGVSMLLWWTGPYEAGRATQTAERPAESIYETAVGERQVYILEDGTAITLNTGTRVGVRYTAGARLLRLESGEVHVQVAKDRLRTLSVLAGDRVVQAVGTAFNIEIRPDQQIELLVTEGTVRVGMQPDTKDTRRILLPSTARIITAGQELVMKQDADEPKPVSEAEIQVKLSWRQGNLVFRGESLAEALAEVKRYTGVEFVFLDPDLKDERVSGFFKAGDVEGMLSMLKENFAIEFQRESENRVLLYAMQDFDSEANP